jgi:hypothetical protein
MLSSRSNPLEIFSVQWRRAGGTASDLPDVDDNSSSLRYEVSVLFVVPGHSMGTR